MNKFIPLTLASVIVIAMIFAVTPIEYAQTTHATSAIVGADSVTSASIAPNTIVSADISNTAGITGAQLAADTITPTQLSDTLTLDATTTIATGTAGLIIDGTNGIQIDATNGLVINKILTGVGSPAGAVIAAGAEETVTVTVTGADTTNDVAICSYNANTDFDAMIITSVVISGANTVTVTTTNPTAAGITTDAGDTIRCFVYGVP